MLTGNRKSNQIVVGQIPIHILIVDDEQDILDILSYSLRQNGFEVTQATNGLEACRLVGEHRPDLILLDIMMPELNGWEVCRLIRSVEDQRMASIPIIMISALGDKDDITKGLELGANDYLPKPFDMNNIISKANKLVNEWREGQLILSRSLRNMIQQ